MSRRPVPSSCPVTQSYWGKYSTQFSGGEYHGATDYGCPLGTPIIAIDDGVVEFADQSWNLPGGPNDWEARWYQIKAPAGDTTKGGGRMVVYVNNAGSALINAHLSKIAVKRGQRVKAGDVIGYAGDSGNAQGVHLHISLMPANPNRNNGAYGAIDLEPFLDEPYKVNSVTVNKEPAQKAGNEVDHRVPGLPLLLRIPGQADRHYHSPLGQPGPEVRGRVQLPLQYYGPRACG